MNIVQQLAAEEKARLLEGKTIPDFQPGDTLRVNVRIKEGERERVQAFEGVCIARDGGGVNETFTVRKISFGEGVERKFPILSPNIESIEVKRRGAVRAGKLYYLRGLEGKKARIREDLSAGAKAKNAKAAADLAAAAQAAEAAKAEAAAAAAATE